MRGDNNRTHGGGQRDYIPRRGCSHNKIGVLVEYPLLAFEYAQVLIGNGASVCSFVTSLIKRPKGSDPQWSKTLVFVNTLNISESPLVGLIVRLIWLTLQG